MIELQIQWIEKHIAKKKETIEKERVKLSDFMNRLKLAQEVNY